MISLLVPSYRSRLPGDTAGFPFPVDSVSLNGKLFLSEEDYRTPISGTSASDADNPVMKTRKLWKVHIGAVSARRWHKGRHNLDGYSGRGLAQFTRNLESR
ncbi:MAG: hypothetical protein R2688_03405 [Fimbriimonadaceae bacterium]